MAQPDTVKGELDGALIALGDSISKDRMARSNATQATNDLSNMKKRAVASLLKYLKSLACDSDSREVVTEACKRFTAGE